MKKPTEAPTVGPGLEIRVTPNGVFQVRIFSPDQRKKGIDFYRSLLPFIERLDKAARQATSAA